MNEPSSQKTSNSANRPSSTDISTKTLGEISSKPKSCSSSIKMNWPRALFIPMKPLRFQQWTGKLEKMTHRWCLHSLVCNGSKPTHHLSSTREPLPITQKWLSIIFLSSSDRNWKMIHLFASKITYMIDFMMGFHTEWIQSKISDL